MLAKGKYWYVCRKGDAVFRIEAEDNRFSSLVLDAAPIVRRWAPGKAVEDVLRWVDEWKGPFE